MIRVERKIEHGKYEYYVNDKKVVDELELSIIERKCLRDFKNVLASGLYIKSKIYGKA